MAFPLPTHSQNPLALKNPTWNFNHSSLLSFDSFFVGIQHALFPFDTCENMDQEKQFQSNSIGLHCSLDEFIATLYRFGGINSLNM